MIQALTSFPWRSSFWRVKRCCHSGKVPNSSKSQKSPPVTELSMAAFRWDQLTEGAKEKITNKGQGSKKALSKPETRWKMCKVGLFRWNWTQVRDSAARPWVPRCVCERLDKLGIEWKSGGFHKPCQAQTRWIRIRKVSFSSAELPQSRKSFLGAALEPVSLNLLKLLTAEAARTWQK